MQFIDLKRQYRQLAPAIQKRINTVLEHGQYIMGPEVAELEQALANFVGTKHCVTVANGTDALMIAMMALGIQAGDEVITTPFTFVATVETIALLGAIPVFVDIDRDTYNIDVTKISAAISAKTRCIMPVSLYGQCADLKAINRIAADYNLPVIEDGAQSFGATHHGKKSCSLTTIGTTSFFPSKPLGCYGDGGACFTDDDDLATAMRQIRVHGQDKRYSHGRVGVNSRLDTLQAAILLAKLEVFDNEVAARIEKGQRYDNLLGSQIRKTCILAENQSVHAQYTIEVPHRSEIQGYLKARNIPTAVHYPKPLHLQPAFLRENYPQGTFPVAEHVADLVMSLPMHPWITEDEQKYVAQQVQEAIAACMEKVEKATA